MLEFGEAEGADGAGLILESAGVRAGLCAVPDAARLLHAAASGHEDRVEVRDVAGGEAERFYFRQFPVQRLGGDELAQRDERIVDRGGACPLSFVGGAFAGPLRVRPGQPDLRAWVLTVHVALASSCLTLSSAVWSNCGTISYRERHPRWANVRARGAGRAANGWPVFV